MRKKGKINRTTRVICVDIIKNKASTNTVLSVGRKRSAKNNKAS
jgi:hypothetical protein